MYWRVLHILWCVMVKWYIFVYISMNFTYGIYKYLSILVCIHVHWHLLHALVCIDMYCMSWSVLVLIFKYLCIFKLYIWDV